MLVALAAIGACGSAMSFHAVYYANADPVHPGRSVGTNEAMVGLGGIAGTLSVGLLAWTDPTSWRPYAVMATLLVAMIGFALLAWQRRATAPGG
jgi:hypothetical protein